MGAPPVDNTVPVVPVSAPRLVALLDKLRALPCVSIRCRNTGIGRPGLVCTRCEAVEMVESWLPKVTP